MVAEPKWLLEISFPQMMHASLSAVKILQGLYGLGPVLGWEIRHCLCVWCCTRAREAAKERKLLGGIVQRFQVVGRLV